MLRLALLLVLAAAFPASAEVATDVAAAEQLLAQGRYAEAYDRFNDLLWDYPGDPRVDFGLGMAAFGLGEYPHAILAYERVLAQQPQADRVRLEMGRTYAAMGQPQQAQEQFAIVLSHNPPDGVRAAIAQYSEHLADGERTWQLSGSILGGYFYDDNVNVGVGASNVVLNGAAFTLADASVRKGDHGQTNAANLTLTRRLSGAWSAGLGATLYQKWHDDQSSQDLAYVKGQLLLQYAGEQAFLLLNVKFEDIDYDYANLVDIRGTEPVFGYALTPSLQCILRGGWERRFHRVDTNRNSAYMKLNGTLRYALLREHEVTLGGEWFDEDARVLKYDNDGYELHAGLGLALPWWRARLYGNVSRRWTDYAGPSTAAMGDINRSDKQWTYTVGLSVPLPKLDGVTADYHVIITDNASNTAIHEYKRTQHEGALSFAF